MPNTIGTTMDDPSNLPGGIGGAISLAGAAIVAATIWLRKFLSSDAVSRSADTAYRALIEDLRAQVALERTRNQELRDSRDAAIKQIDGLKEQVSALSEQVSKLQRQLEGMHPRVPL